MESAKVFSWSNSDVLWSFWILQVDQATSDFAPIRIKPWILDLGENLRGPLMQAPGLQIRFISYFFIITAQRG